jgi:hypothetical protein
MERERQTDTESEIERGAPAPVDAVPVGAVPVGAMRRVIAKKPEGLAPKIARVVTLMVVLAVGFGLVTYQRARGQLGESLLGTGSQMMLLADAERQDAPRELVVNGQRIRFSTGIVPYSSGALLDRFEERCNAIDAGLMERVSQAVAEDPDRAPHDIGSHSPVLRQMNGAAGFVACLDLGPEDSDLQELAQRAQRFTQTRDLHDLGDLRYIYAQPLDGDPDADRAHFVAIWTEGSLRFDQIFRETGDAIGVDPVDVPRLPGSRRLLSAFERGDSQRATIYRTDELDEGAAERFYRRELAASGWTVLGEHDPRAHLDGARPSLVVQQGPRVVFLSFSTDSDGRVSSAVIETGPIGES